METLDDGPLLKSDREGKRPLRCLIEGTCENIEYRLCTSSKVVSTFQAISLERSVSIDTYSEHMPDSMIRHWTTISIYAFVKIYVPVAQLDHMRRLQRLLSIVIGRCAVCLVWRKIVVVLKLDRCSGLRIVRSVLLIR